MDTTIACSMSTKHFQRGISFGILTVLHRANEARRHQILIHLLLIILRFVCSRWIEIVLAELDDVWYRLFVVIFKLTYVAYGLIAYCSLDILRLKAEIILCLLFWHVHGKCFLQFVLVQIVVMINHIDFLVFWNWLLFFIFERRCVVEILDQLLNMLVLICTEAVLLRSRAFLSIADKFLVLGAVVWLVIEKFQEIGLVVLLLIVSRFWWKILL